MEKLCAFLKKNVSAFVVVIWWMVTLVTFAYGLFYDNVISSWIGIGLLIVGFLVIMRYVYADIKQAEQKQAERMKALDYAMELKCGRKVEFIHIYGEEMYAYFLEQGYIHELRQSQVEGVSPQWELTRLGEDFYKRFYQA